MMMPDVSRVPHSGAWVVSGEDADGYMVTLTFYDYTRAEAIALWREQAPTYWRDMIRKENRERART